MRNRGFNNHAMSLEISDGVGSASLIVNRETMSELELSKMTITENSILVMRGRISRQPNDSTTTVLVSNEAPRLILAGGS